MAEPRLTVLCHFRNEEVYLPYWLRHHTKLFDHGVMIDYASTDRSQEIIRELAPTWEVRPSRNKMFDSASIDAEVMDIEKEFSGWKMCLNVTEFVLHHNLGEYLQVFEERHPGAAGVMTTGFIIQDSPEQVAIPLTDADLWQQRHFGCAEPDPVNGNCVLRRRLLHRDSHGRYTPGRHNNGVTAITEPPLYLFWYGWCPLELKKRRNKSTTPMVPKSDLQRGWGVHHTLTDDQITEAWKERYLPRCHDLLDGRYPDLNAAVARLARTRDEFVPVTPTGSVVERDECQVLSSADLPSPSDQRKQPAVGARLTVLCHFRNEEVFLPYWLRHHTRLFDHGILIDYASTDRSREIIQELAPTWEIRPSRNKAFHSASIDAEVMDIEKEFSGWKMCLNVTEFVIHHDLRGFISRFERSQPESLGLVTTGFIIQDAPEQVNQPLTDKDLWEQRHFGCHEPDPFHGVIDRGRLLHKSQHGAYGIGRHSNGVSRCTEPPLYLFWYGWCPLTLKKHRNKSTAPMVPSCDWGSHHVVADARIDELWRTRYLPQCYDLFDGRWPSLNEAVEGIRGSRGDNGSDTQRTSV